MYCTETGRSTCTCDGRVRSSCDALYLRDITLYFLSVRSDKIMKSLQLFALCQNALSPRYHLLARDSPRLRQDRRERLDQAQVVVHHELAQWTGFAAHWYRDDLFLRVGEACGSEVLFELETGQRLSSAFLERSSHS